MIILGKFNDEWINDLSKLDLNEMHPGLIKLRIAYFIVFYIISIPLLL